MADEDVALTVQTVNCSTSGCPNEGIGITLLASDYILCGVCEAVLAGSPILKQMESEETETEG